MNGFSQDREPQGKSLEFVVWGQLHVDKQLSQEDWNWAEISRVRADLHQVRGLQCGFTCFYLGVAGVFTGVPSHVAGAMKTWLCLVI